MSEVSIIRLSVLDHEPDEHGTRLVALFDCRTRGIKLESCGLWLRPKGYLTLAQPRRRHQSGDYTGGLVADLGLQVTIIRAAHTVAIERVPAFPPFALPPSLQAIANKTDPAAGLRKYLSASAR